MLNTLLTVREKEPLSHAKKGWEEFTDAVIRALVLRKEPLVFILWGKSAKDKVEKALQGSKNHLVITAPHPSPFSAYTGFFGSKPFSRANQFLAAKGQKQVNWASILSEQSLCPLF